MLDVRIDNVDIVDGTGAPSRQGSVGIRQGRIVLDISEPASQVIEGDGLTLTPGFVDVHTHYDPQIMWDGAATPSLFHGTTSVIGGNCGFSIAPLQDDTRDYVMRMMAVVEGLPLVALESGLDWGWTTFGSWLSRLDGELAINAGFLVGHNALRLAVMGPSAVGGAATPQQIAQMVRLLEESLDVGALGFSTTQKNVHIDHNGDLVPSVAATPDELLELAGTLRRFPGTSLEFAADGLGRPTYPERDIKLMTEMSRRANRPVNWNTVRVVPGDPEYAERQLRGSTYADAHGGRIVGLANPKPVRLRVSFGSGIPLNGLPGWAPTFGLDLPEREAALRDPEVRRYLRAAEHAELRESQQPLVRWAEYTVASAPSPQVSAHEGRTVGEIASDLGREPFDVLVDLGIADGLQAAFYSPESDNSPEAWRERSQVWRDPRVLVGGADAGAHVDMMCGASFSTTLLGEHVRDRQLLSVEEAVQMLTDAPARLYGLTDRGRIRDGWHADLVLFDPRTVGPGTEYWADDLPGGGGYLNAFPTGIHRVFVNGREVVRDNALTGDKSGSVLRGGRDTDRVTV